MRLRKAETMHTNELMKSCGEEDFDEDFGGLESGAMMRASKKSKLKRKGICWNQEHEEQYIFQK
jgi:hypothetical protein